MLSTHKGMLLFNGITKVSKVIQTNGLNSGVILLVRNASSQVYQENVVRITTCRKVYTEKGSKHYIFKKCPPEGITIDVTYADTKPGDSHTVPTILALHGAPGNYKDYKKLIEHFGKREVRVIAPNFPSMAFTDKTRTFRHTTEEKVEYLRDFLKEINVDKIDLAVMHSSAVYPCLKLWNEEPDLMKSLVMINPAGHRVIKAMKPEWFISNLTRMTLTPFGRWLFSAIGKPIIASKGVAVNVDDIDNVVLAANTMYLARSHRLKKYLKVLRERRTPTLYMFSESDKLVDTKIFYEMAEMLGANEKQYTYYDKEGNATKEAEEDWLKIALFISGGHYAFVKYADVVNREVENLLEGVLNANIKPALAIDLVEGVNQTEYKLTDEPALNKKEVASDSSFKPKSAYGFSFQK